jgi:YVTN family beta-propeller protein
MDYRILGPLEVSDGDRPLALGGEKQRALLAVLLLHAGEVVSADRLIDDLWGERSPPGAPGALQARISRLRKALDADGARLPGADGEPDGPSFGGPLVTRGHGYLLRVQPGELDLDRFQTVVEEGRRALDIGDPERAADTLRAGLALWRGEPLADFAYEAFAQAPIAQLEELRLGAVEDRIDADLALGRHERLVGELAALVKQNRLRERLRMQLMLALYRCGRQAEALDVYQEYRRGLAEELGLDPSPRLQRLEAAILERDPSLDRGAGSPPPVERSVGARPSRPARGRRRDRWLVLGGLVLIVAAVAAAVLVSQGGSAPASAIAADSVGAISPVRGAVTADVHVGSSPSSVAAGEGALWVTNYSDGTVSRIDPATNAIAQTVEVDSTPSGIAVGAGAVWVANNDSGTVSKIDPTVNRVVQTIPVGNAPSGVAVGYGSVWVANSSDGTLSRINANTGTVTNTIALGGATDVAAGYGAVWVSDEPDGRVLQIDPQTNQVTQGTNVGTGPTAITAGYRSVWVANSLDGTVSRINPKTANVVGVVQVGDGPDAIAAGAGGVWVANEYDGTVVRIDPATVTVARTITVGNSPRGLAITGGLVWAGSQASDMSHRGGTLAVLYQGPLGSLDPAQAYAPALIQLTNDGLTALKHIGGPDGAQVVPDLATALPAPTDGSLTYTFQLRPGIRYSDGQLVRPEDFRRAIERDFKLGDAIAPNYYANLVGGAACLAHPQHCDLSRGIVADDSAGTVTFHLDAPDPELLYRLAVWDAVAVPAGTPDHDVGQRAIPATGPYEVAGVTSQEVRLVRNPYFHEWSRAARPDGYPDQIILKLGASPSAELTAVERESADYTLDGPPADRLGEVRTRFASQLHINPSDTLDMLVLDTRVVPFNDLRVRRALNYAVDRAKIASLAGSAAQSTCQFLTPNIPGYRRYCPYTADPNSAGVWRAPDFATAERLIAASHTRGTAITVWNLGLVAGNAIAVGRYIVSLLDRLGYRARQRNLSANAPAALERFADSRTKAQVALLTYFPNYPAASEFIKWLLSCQNFLPNSTASPNWAEFCDPRLDGQIQQALAAQEANSPATTDLWAQADRTVTDNAPLVPLAIPSIIDFVSRRVGNYQYSPQLGGSALIDQMWVK